MPHVAGLRCVRCRKEHADRGPTGPMVYACDHCGGNLEVRYDLQAVKKGLTRQTLADQRSRGIWRYEALFPATAGALEDRLNVGDTPLVRAPILGQELGLAALWLKDDSRNPSASFKDRASAVALSVAHARGEKLMAGASTGNAASSTACLAARTGMKTVIFVPESAPKAKVAQILLFGAHVIAVRGTYDAAFDLCVSACERFGWFNRNTGMNPYTREGKKTCAFELVEQLGWTVPDVVLVSCGDGNILSGLWKGFAELKALGLVDKTPRLIAVQAEKSNAVKLAFEGDGVIKPVSGETLADSISVSLPRDGDAAVRALKESGGAAVAVSDEAILDAMRLLARTEGLFAEPAAAATVAGLQQAAKAGLVKAEETVVAVITGSGLKDVAGAMRASGEPHVIDPQLDAVEKLLKEKVQL